MQQRGLFLLFECGVRRYVVTPDGMRCALNGDCRVIRWARCRAERVLAAKRFGATAGKKHWRQRGPLVHIMWHREELTGLDARERKASFCACDWSHRSPRVSVGIGGRVRFGEARSLRGMEKGGLLRASVEVAGQHGGGDFVEVLDDERFDLFAKAGGEI